MCVCGIVGIRTSDISVELIGHFLNETYNLFMENDVRLLFFPALLTNLIRNVPNKATLFPILFKKLFTEFLNIIMTNTQLYEHNLWNFS